MLIFAGCCGVSGLEKLVWPFGLVGHGTGIGAGVCAGAMVLPIFASLPLRVEFALVRPLLFRGVETLCMIVADLERLPETKLPSKEDRSIPGSPSSEKASSGESRSLLRLEDGESPSGFSRASIEAFVG